MHGSGYTSKLLKDKTAIIFGAGGAVGSAVARGFAEEGARVFLTGRNLDSVSKVASAIAAEGGVAESAQVDALDEQAVEKHASAVVRTAGAIYISFNASGIPQQGIQGIPLAELSVEAFTLPMEARNPHTEQGDLR